MGTLQKTALEGTWGEYVPGSTDRQYSLGRIFWDKRRKIYAFDGTNFSNDGEAFCHWQTLTSYLDRSNGQYFYTFRASVANDPGTYYGFGVVNLATDDRGRLAPVDGHYVSASVDGKGMSHSMVRAAELKYSRRVRGVDAIAFVKALTPKPSRIRRVAPANKAGAR